MIAHGITRALQLWGLISGAMSSHFHLFQYSTGWAAVPSMTLLARSPPNPPVNLLKSFIANNMYHNNWLYCTYTYILLPVKDYRSGHKRWEFPNWLYFALYRFFVHSTPTSASQDLAGGQWTVFLTYLLFFPPDMSGLTSVTLVQSIWWSYCFLSFKTNDRTKNKQTRLSWLCVLLGFDTNQKQGNKLKWHPTHWLGFDGDISVLPLYVIGSALFCQVHSIHCKCLSQGKAYNRISTEINRCWHIDSIHIFLTVRTF